MSTKRDGEEEIPAYLKNVGRGTRLRSFGPEDHAWLGADRDLDPEKLLEERGFDPEPPLEPILLAIIDAHPEDEKGRSRQERLEIALAALIGTQRKRGMDYKDDYDLLLEMAWQYAAEFWANGGKDPAVGPIAGRVIEALPDSDPRKLMSDKKSVVRRLSDKFKTDRDLLLARATSENDWSRLDVIRAINKIIDKIRELGIPAVPQTAKPRLRPADAKGD